MAAALHTTRTGSTRGGAGTLMLRVILSTIKVEESASRVLHEEGLCLDSQVFFPPPLLSIPIRTVSPCSAGVMLRLSSGDYSSCHVSTAVGCDQSRPWYEDTNSAHVLKYHWDRFGGHCKKIWAMIYSHKGLKPLAVGTNFRNHVAHAGRLFRLDDFKFLKY